ncbi:SLAM family member 6-like isoform X2 [Sapajus apella]|uniref:SLAM family member 6-like isoform X2 n=1 Tax=Sapajus apella TaxID=9515 RepID=A0A6J3IZD9_SAPAP|nr:SLAM family member 6-like isoform X2 [Sapajus apella]
MKPLARLLFFLLQFQEGNLVSQTSSTPLMVNGVLGESVTLPLEFPAAEKIKSITWLYNGTSIAFIEPSKTKSPQIHVTNLKRGKRLNFTQSYSLQLSSLEMEDTGSYSAQVSSETTVKVSSYTLRIFKRLSRPDVRVESIISENGICNAILRCSVEEGGETITYEWTSVGPGAAVSHVGSNLNGSWSLHDLDWSYITCTALNPASNSNSTPIHAAQLCAGFKAAEGTYCPVNWIFLGKGLLLLVFLGVLGTWYIKTQVLSKRLRPNSG